jgi:hypothetical protein
MGFDSPSCCGSIYTKTAEGAWTTLKGVSRPPICKIEDTGAAQFEPRLNQFSSAGGVQASSVD